MYCQVRMVCDLQVMVFLLPLSFHTLDTMRLGGVITGTLDGARSTHCVLLQKAATVVMRCSVLDGTPYVHFEMHSCTKLTFVIASHPDVCLGGKRCQELSRSHLH